MVLINQKIGDKKCVVEMVGGVDKQCSGYGMGFFNSSSIPVFFGSQIAIFTT